MYFKLCLFLGLLFFGASRQHQTPALVGQKAPIINQIALSGDSLNSSNLHGNIVLIDFWASWNLPSRKHNLSSLKIYEKYRAQSLRKKRKFIVIQISLDTKPDLLQTAISKDNLYWKYHLCDYKGWESEYISQFNLRRIPTNFLLDTNGVIVAKDLWEDKLDNAVQRLMQ